MVSVSFSTPQPRHNVANAATIDDDIRALPAARRWVFFLSLAFMVGAWLLAMVLPWKTARPLTQVMGAVGCVLCLGDCVGLISRSQWRALGVGVAVNVLIGGLVNAVTLPFYFDAIGTVGATIVAGPLVGSAVAMTSHGIGALFSKSLLLFTICQLMTVAGVWAMVLRKSTGRLDLLILGGTLIGAVTGAVGGFTAVHLFGVTRRAGINELIKVIASLGGYPAIWTIVLSSLTDIVDKTLSLMLSVAVLKTYKSWASLLRS